MTESRDLEWRDVPEPALESAGQALVRPLAVALCDLDQPIIRGQAPIPGPIALGHECVAEVVEVGDEVSGRVRATWCRSRSRSPAATAVPAAGA